MRPYSALSPPFAETRRRWRASTSCTANLSRPTAIPILRFTTASRSPAIFLPISPDVAICADCRRELFDPADRRYRYPFINCTNCGPRFTIIRDIPYDRPNTTMAGFPLCPDCQAEYEDPRDRRFHAQPVACPVCGPQVWFEANGANGRGPRRSASSAPAHGCKQAKSWRSKGWAASTWPATPSNPAAVAELRRRKKRSDKPFALMAFDLETIQKHCSCRAGRSGSAQRRTRRRSCCSSAPTRSPV